MKIHHVGYLVKNINKSVKIFEALGYVTEQPVIFDKFRGIDICFMMNGDYRIELVSPRTQDSVVVNLRKKIGNSPYHICYEAEDIDEAVISLRRTGFVVWQKPYAAAAISGRKVVFLVNSQIGMIELVEK